MVIPPCRGCRAPSGSRLLLDPRGREPALVMRSKSLHRFVWVVAAGRPGRCRVDGGAPDLAGLDRQRPGHHRFCSPTGLVVGEWLPTRIWRGDTFRQYTFSGTFTVAPHHHRPVLAGRPAADRRPAGRRGTAAQPPAEGRVQPQSVRCLRMVVRPGRLRRADRPAVRRATPTQFTTDQLLPSLLAAAVYFLVNVLLVSSCWPWPTANALLPSVVGHLRDEISMTTMLLCVAPVVVLSLQFSLLTAPLCLLPIAAVRQAARGRRREQRPGDARLVDRPAEPAAC